MVKLLLCILSAALLAVCILRLREQRMEWGNQAAQLHDQIRSQQARLWNQQMQIAVYTAPNAIAQTVKGHHFDMVPQSPMATHQASWIERHRDPDAE